MRKILEFDDCKEAIFIKRINRFLVKTSIGLANLKDSGRLPNLLKGSKILLIKKDYKKRKTKYEILAFEHENKWIFSNSGYHSLLFEKSLNKNLIRLKKGSLKKEVKVEHSRIDFQIGKTLIEIKGCTWCVEDYCYFPDTRTIRGEKHLEILKKYKGILIFLAFCGKKVKIVEKNFRNKLKECIKHGVRVRAYKYSFRDCSLYFEGKIPVEI